MAYSTENHSCISFLFILLFPFLISCLISCTAPSIKCSTLHPPRPPPPQQPGPFFLIPVMNDSMLSSVLPRAL